MDDESVATFVSFTGSAPEVARRYLGMTDNDVQQAIQLFFDSPDLASGFDRPAEPSAPPINQSTRPRNRATSQPREDSQGVVRIDSDDDDDLIDVSNDNEITSSNPAAAAAAQPAIYEDDEAIARKMQEELYAGGYLGGGFDTDDVRAPLARTTETLVGGSEEGWGSEGSQTAMLQAMRARARAPGRPGVFNQRPVPSIWDDQANSEARRQGLAQATGGASERSSKAARLAELFRPPFELMNQIPWDAARDKGKEELKWLLVNVQDPSIFDCQQLNRDIWKNEGIRDLVKENFVFMQYSKDDPRADQYCQYYFPLKDNDTAYPHIAIVDPRTGEQVKVWSGPPVPQAQDFLMQLVEFLDRYSLDLSKKNPVAKRKHEKPKAVDVDRLTEEEMLDLALQNSLANTTPSAYKEPDPDDLTKSFGEFSGNENAKGKGKAVEQSTGVESTNGHENQASVVSPFSRILSNNPQPEPEQGPDVTRIQFRHSNGRIVRRFRISDPVIRIYEWLKSEPIEGKAGVGFDLKGMGKDLIEHLGETIEQAGLKNGTVMVEFLED